MQIAISVYQQRGVSGYSLTPIAPGLFEWTISAGDLSKARQRLIERVRKELPRVPRTALGRLRIVAGRRLQRVHLELVLRDDGEKKRVTGHFPVVVEERDTLGESPMRTAFHPLRAAVWFELSQSADLAADVATHYSRILDPSDDLDTLKSRGSEKLLTLRFDVDAPGLQHYLKAHRPDDRAGTGHSGQLEALLRVAVNQTARAAQGQLQGGTPRERERQALAQKLCGKRKSSVILVGPPGCGKSTVIARAVLDLLQADEYPAHGNLDRVHNVLALTGRQIIAGMSYVGQWEARCVELLTRCRRKQLILWIGDLPAFASLGKTTLSERSLADFFRGPVARGDVVIVGECTPEQLTALQYEAPAFAHAFEVLSLPAATSQETANMLLERSRWLEQELNVAFDPRSLLAILDHSGHLSSGVALPGRALTPLDALARHHAPDKRSERQAAVGIGVEDVLRAFSDQTGVPELLLTDQPLTRAELARELAQHVIGQDAAIEAACDVILSMKTRLSASGRPYGVLLFTGPTGTGKTELGKCLAEYIFGAHDKLVRFDMSELNTPDAVARLIGDAFEPEGQLTSAVRSQPFSLLLFDEIEKAHPSVLNLMLQLFEDARLCDARGTVTDFSHTLVVLTSNLGARPSGVPGFDRNNAAVAADVARAVREFFPPELFNRIDRVVPFQHLERETARAIVRKELGALVARQGLVERQTFVRFTEAVIARVTDEGYDPAYGARALKRHVEREVVDELTRVITSADPAEARVLWLHARENAPGVGVLSEALREIEPLSIQHPLAHWMKRDYDELLAEVPQALEALRRFESDGRIAQLGERLSAELLRYRLGERGRADEVFNLDSVRRHASELRARIEARTLREPELLALERLHKLKRGESLSAHDFATEELPFAATLERVKRNSAEQRFPERSPQRSRLLLQDLAEVSVLERLLDHAHEADHHVALVEVLQLSLHTDQRRFAKAGPGLCSWLSRAYAQARGGLESAALLRWDGTAQPILPGDLQDAVRERPKLVALRLIGPGVFDFLRHEAGCHVRRTLTAGSEIVRVRVLAGHHDPLSWISEHQRAARAFEDGLEGRGAVTENPARLLPVIRSVRFEPEHDRPSTAQIEDYRFAHVATSRVRELGELLHEFWLLGAVLPQSELAS